MSINVSIEGLDVFLESIKKAPEAADEAAVLSLNTIARRAHAASSREIRKQVNFTAGYLGAADGDGNLRVSKFARHGRPEAIITGRRRPTSLATFAVGSLQRGRPVKVKVSTARGGRTIRGAFPIRLRQGAELTDTAFNRGLAIRLKPGETIRNKRVQVKALRGGIYLLYGPSVDQIFRSVSAQVAEDFTEPLQLEFLRQFNRLSGI